MGEAGKGWERSGKAGKGREKLPKLCKSPLDLPLSPGAAPPGFATGSRNGMDSNGAKNPGISVRDEPDPAQGISSQALKPLLHPDSSTFHTPEPRNSTARAVPGRMEPPW